ncbi:MAG: hypothetical protein AABZ74_15585, partial [Cyanobacteriota bacterium]
EVVVPVSGALPTIQGWMSGTGLYSVIRGALTGVVVGIKVSNSPPDPTLGSTIIPGTPDTLGGPPNPGPAAPGGSYTYSGGGADDLYDQSIGNAKSTEGGTIAGNKSNIRDAVPAFGGGNDPNITDLFEGLPNDVRDTLLKDPTVVADLQGALNDITKSFVGRQYDDIIKGNGYWGKYNSADAAAIIGIQYGVVPTASPILPLVNTEKSVNKAGASYTMAGSNGLAGLISDSTYMAMGIGPDLNLGHASAISEGLLKYGTIGLGSFALNIPIPIPPPINITLWVGGKTQVTRDVVTETIVDFFAKIKTLMVETMQTQAYSASSGTVFDTYASKGENHFSNLGFVEGLRNVNITMMGVEIPIGKMVSSLIKGDGSGGTSGIASLPSPIGLGISPALASDAYTETLNKANEGERMFEMKHGVQTPETRETDTGAFFATQSFLSQFSMQNMESNYWVGTQQNEELVDTDFLRSLSSVGTMFLNTLQTLLQMIGGSSNAGAVEKALSAAKDLVLEKDKINLWNNLFFKDQNTKNKMNNVVELAIANPAAAINVFTGGFPLEIPVDPTKGVLINTPMVGALIGGQVKKSEFKSEAYDYLESDHKPFEGDSDFNYPEPPTSMIGSILSMTGSGLADLFKGDVPPNIMEGYAATMRFTSKDGSGNPIEQMSISDFDPNPPAGDFETPYGIGPRALAGRSGAAGLWTDTQLGDINEVYVGSRKVVFTDLENGFNTFDAAALKANMITDTGLAGASAVGADTVTGSSTDRQTFASAQRYIGADTRAYGRRYDGGEAPSFESFNTNIYTSAGGSYRYDRKNEYSLKFTTKASGKALDLQGAQALNPFIGGFIKMADIEKNKHDSVLMNYDDIDRVNKIRWDTIKDDLGNVVAYNQGVTAAPALRKTGATLENTKNIIAYNADDQQFGGASDGTMNELNKTLYEHMHLRADGQNLSLFKEYKDVFNMGFMKNIFVSGQSYHPSGGGISSSIEIRYDPFGGAGIDKVQTDSRESYDSVSNNVMFDPYNSITLQKTRGKASVYLNNYFASKKRSSSK